MIKIRKKKKQESGKEEKKKQTKSRFSTLSHHATHYFSFKPSKSHVDVVGGGNRGEDGCDRDDSVMDGGGKGDKSSSAAAVGESREVKLGESAGVDGEVKGDILPSCLSNMEEVVVVGPSSSESTL